METLFKQINTSSEGYQKSIDLLWQRLDERKKKIDEGTPAEGDSIDQLTKDSAAAAYRPWNYIQNEVIVKGGRRRKSSSRRGRSSTKKRGTQRKQKRRQRRASRRAY